jgi:hypothetical protein
MWILTTLGFFSIVQHQDDRTLVMVRARVRADLEALIQAAGWEVPIIRTPYRDYPYRVIVTQRRAAQALSKLATDLDYTNFKSAVGQRQGHQRAMAYHAVWHDLQAIEDHGARAPVSEPAPAKRRRSKKGASP